MQMVATSRMRKAQQAALAGRPYSSRLRDTLNEVVTAAGDFSHPLMERRPVANRCVVVVSTDKGLCGALNSNLLREAARFDISTTFFVAAGRKAAQFIGRTQRRLAAEFTFGDPPLFADARAVSKAVREMFLDGDVDQVDILFNHFVSTLTQQPELRPFLPVGEIAPAHEDKLTEPAPPPSDRPQETREFLFEPSPAEVLGALLPHDLNFQVYQILLEARASEHSARMVAMKNATDNATQLIKDLTIEYNKMRQANITAELLEIATAQMAMG
jgi:F-type H+-transporting ATPase subunit gamma